MTNDDIIRLANEARLCACKWVNDDDDRDVESLYDFVALVAAAEREACAALCFQMWNEWMDNEYISELNRPDAEDCAHAIRKSGQG